MKHLFRLNQVRCQTVRMNKGKDKGLSEGIEEFLREAMKDMKPEPSHKRGQPRILPALALWSGMLVCIARGFSSQLELWRLLSSQGLWDFPRYTITDDAVYKRLKKASQDTLKVVFEQVTNLLQERFRKPVENLASFATGVYALDEVTLDEVKKRLPKLREQAQAVLPGKLTALFDLRRQLWSHLEFQDNPHQNEKVAARGMVSHLPKGSLLLADLGYFAFAWFDDLTEQGYYWLSRLRSKTSYTVLHTFYEREGVLDALVWLGAYRSDQAAQAVRLVVFSHKGTTWRYLTNVLDPKLFSIRDISRLYARRWDIEMMFNLVKTHLNLHLLWSSHTNVVLHQVFAVFTVAQVILGLRSDIAHKAKADVFEVSLDLMIRWLPRFAASGDDPVKLIVERGRQAKIIRPSSRLKPTAPDIPLNRYLPLPPHLPLARSPRYAAKL
jgi:hypothetical protein